MSGAGRVGRRQAWPARAVSGAVMLLVAVVGLVAGAGPASAHNILTGTSPKDGSTVGQTPGRVVLTFNQPALAMGTQVIVRGPDGSVSEGSAQLVDNTVQQRISGGAPAGAYTVVWRVTSADGHPISGSFGFRSSAAGAPQADSAPPGPATTTPPAARSPLLPVLIGVAVLLVAGLVVGLILRRRRATPGRDADSADDSEP